ncbi:MAG: hypothetical protein ACLFQ5_05740, partial [Oceanicaulis sp.]
MLEFDKRPSGAKGWLRTRHAYRGRIVDEIQKRAEYPLTDYGRVSRIMLAGPTATDVFRRELLRRRRGREAFGDEETMREALRELITSLAPDGCNTPVGQAYSSLADAIGAVTRAMPPVQEAYRIAARDAFKTLLGAFEPHGVFAPPAPDPGDGRDAAYGLMPFRSGGAQGKYWLNLTRPGEDARLRLHREAYPANETISVWQD